MGKVILKTALVTFLCILIVFGGAVSGFVLFAPKTVAQSCENLGLNNLSLQMYQRSYEKEKDVQTLHTLVSKSISFKNGSSVIKYYPKLESHKDYNQYIAALDKANFDKDAKVLVNLKLSNEDNRLKTRYVAYLSDKDFAKSFDYAVADIYDIDTQELYTNFCIIGLVNNIDADNISLFTTSENSYGKALCEKIKELKEALATRYAAMTDASIYDKAVTSSILVDILQFMLYLESKSAATSYDKVALTNELQAIFADYQNYIS